MEITVELVAEKIAKKSREYDMLISQNNSDKARICDSEIDALLSLRKRLYKGDKSALEELNLI